MTTKEKEGFTGAAAALARAGREDEAHELAAMRTAEGKQTGPPNSPLFRYIWGGEGHFAAGVSNALALRNIERDHMQPILDAARRGIMEGRDYVREAQTGRQVINPDLLRELNSLGLFGTTVPEKFKGAGLDDRVLAKMFLELGRLGAMHYPAVTSATAVIGPKVPVERHGSAEQQGRVLRGICQGQVGFFSLTAVAAGVAAVQSREGYAVKVDGGYMLHATINAEGDINRDGRRMWATGADYGNEGVVVLSDNANPRKKLMFLLKLPAKDGQGFTLLRYNRRAFATIPNNGIELVEFFVPDSALIDYDGVAALFEGLNGGRAMLCPMYAGLIDFLLRQMLEWSKVRMTAGRKTLFNTANVRRALAETAAYRCGIEALGAMLTQELEAGSDLRIEAAMAKAWATEAAYRVARRVQDAFGGFFFLEEHPVGRFLGELLVGVTFEGPNSPILDKALSDLLDLHTERYFTPLEPLMEEAGIDVVDLWSRKGRRVAWQSVMSKDVYPGDAKRKIPANEHPYRHYGRGLVAWMLRERRRVKKLNGVDFATSNADMSEDALFAARTLQGWPMHITEMMRTHGRKLLKPEFEGLMGVEATRLSDAMALLTTNRWAENGDSGVKAAVSLLGEMMKAKIEGRDPERDGSYWRAVDRVCWYLERDEFSPIANCPTHPSLFKVPDANSGETASSAF